MHIDCIKDIGDGQVVMPSNFDSEDDVALFKEKQ